MSLALAQPPLLTGATLRGWPFGELAPYSYELIVADPPWDFENYSAKGTLKGADPHYPVMPLDEIKRLRVGELATRDCLLLLWTTGWAMATGQAQAVAIAWGFKPVTELVWRKLTANGKPRMGPGYRARTLHEPILLGTIGAPRHQAFPSLFDGVAREHSRKPESFYRMIDTHAPGLASRADLFARVTRPGWAAWGSETSKFDTSEDTT